MVVVMSESPRCVYGKNGMCARSSWLIEIGLRAVHDNQIRPQRQDAFDVRIDQSADPRKPLRFGRVVVETADADNTVAGAHGEEHLGRGGNDGDDPCRRRVAD